MAPKSVFIGIFFLFFVFCCQNQKQNIIDPVPDIEFDLPLKQETPVLQVLDYKNRGEGTVLAPWVRRYLENGIAGIESLDIYHGSYLFVASIRSKKLPVINQWVEKYNPERDFSRLAAERIQKRLELDLPGKPPDMVYGPNYEKTLKTAYQNAFWGAIQLDNSWVYALRTVQDEDAEPETPQFWGFILLSIPRETLEIQVVELLSKISNSATAGGRVSTKEQNTAFDHVKEHFFEEF